MGQVTYKSTMKFNSFDIPVRQIAYTFTKTSLKNYEITETTKRLKKDKEKTSQCPSS